jgi:protein-S-isoprenylcysteine O-methyltransferase Ste14
MEEHERNRHIAGYIVGILLFVITIPSLIYLTSQIGHSFFSIPIMNSNVARIIIVTFLFVVGLIFTIWSNIDLFRIGKGGPLDVFYIEISPRSKKLVVSGPYRLTRNPMAFGVNSIYFAIAFFVNSLASLICCAFLLILVVLYLKLTEEKRLLKDFGDEYREYKKRVSMIIPFPKRKIGI